MGLEKFVLTFFDFVGEVDFNMFSFVLGLVFIVFWLVIIGWVWIDSGERTSKGWIRFVYILLVLVLNIPGVIIYLIVRPSETIEEIYWADLERRYLKYETAELGDCPKCGSQLYPGYVFCMNCGYRLKRKCPRCNLLVGKDHKYCEFCGFQLRDRVSPTEKYPDVSVMEKQIVATKEHATKTVEAKRTRYKTGHSFVVKLGNAVLGAMGRLKTVAQEKVKSTQAGAEDVKKEIVTEERKEIKQGNVKAKKRKKKKRR